MDPAPRERAKTTGTQEPIVEVECQGTTTIDAKTHAKTPLRGSAGSLFWR